MFVGLADLFNKQFTKIIFPREQEKHGYLYCTCKNKNENKSQPKKCPKKKKSKKKQQNKLETQRVASGNQDKSKFLAVDQFQSHEIPDPELSSLLENATRIYKRPSSTLQKIATKSIPASKSDLNDKSRCVDFLSNPLGASPISSTLQLKQSNLDSETITIEILNKNKNKETVENNIQISNLNQQTKLCISNSLLIEKTSNSYKHEIHEKAEFKKKINPDEKFQGMELTKEETLPKVKTLPKFNNSPKSFSPEKAIKTEQTNKNIFAPNESFLCISNEKENLSSVPKLLSQEDPNYKPSFDNHFSSDDDLCIEGVDNAPLNVKLMHFLNKCNPVEETCLVPNNLDQNENLEMLSRASKFHRAATHQKISNEKICEILNNESSINTNTKSFPNQLLSSQSYSRKRKRAVDDSCEYPVTEIIDHSSCLNKFENLKADLNKRLFARANDSCLPPGTEKEDFVSRETESNHCLPPGTESDDCLPPGTESDDCLPPGTENDDSQPPGTDSDECLPPGTENDDCQPPGTDSVDCLPPGTENDDCLPPGTEGEEISFMRIETSHKKKRVGEEKISGMPCLFDNLATKNDFISKEASNLKIENWSRNFNELSVQSFSPFLSPKDKPLHFSGLSQLDSSISQMKSQLIHPPISSLMEGQLIYPPISSQMEGQLIYPPISSQMEGQPNYPPIDFNDPFHKKNFKNFLSEHNMQHLDQLLTSKNPPSMDIYPLPSIDKHPSPFMNRNPPPYMNRGKRFENDLQPILQSADEISKYQKTFQPQRNPSHKKSSSLMCASDLEMTNTKKCDDLKKARKKKSEKQRAASRAYLDSRRVEIKREAEKKRHDASLPCPFFKKKGFCDFGDQCRFSHNIEVDQKVSLCKYYVVGACRKGKSCLFMHEKWPCRFHHVFKSCNQGISCKYSHEQMTPEVQKVFEEFELSQEETRSANNALISSSSPTISDIEKTNEVLGPALSTKFEEENQDSTSVEQKTTEGFIFPKFYYELS